MRKIDIDPIVTAVEGDGDDRAASAIRRNRLLRQPMEVMS